MTKPMSDARLARLAADNELTDDQRSGVAVDEVAEILAEVTRLRTDLDAAAKLLGDHLSSEECWISESGTCIKHGSFKGEPCRMPRTRTLLKQIHAVQLHPHNAHVGCIYPGCVVPGHKPRTWDYPVGG